MHSPENRSDFKAIDYIYLQFDKDDPKKDTIEFSRAGEGTDSDKVWKVKEFCDWFGLSPEQMEFVRLAKRRKECSCLFYNPNERYGCLLFRPRKKGSAKDRNVREMKKGVLEDLLAAKPFGE